MAEEIEDSVYQQLIKMGLSEQQIKGIAGMRALDTEEGIQKRKGTMADELRDTQSPGGRTVSNGRIFVASNPLEQFGALANVGVGEELRNRADDSMRDIAKQRAERTVDWLGGNSGPQGFAAEDTSGIGEVGGAPPMPIVPPQTPGPAPSMPPAAMTAPAGPVAPAPALQGRPAALRSYGEIGEAGGAPPMPVQVPQTAPPMPPPAPVAPSMPPPSGPVNGRQVPSGRSGLPELLRQLLARSTGAAQAQR